MSFEETQVNYESVEATSNNSNSGLDYDSLYPSQYPDLYKTMKGRGLFNVIVCVDKNGGIGKNGTMAWRSKKDMAHFKENTIGSGNNAAIMGKTTYLSIPEKFRPLENRHNIVISTKMEDSDPRITVVASLEQAIRHAIDERFDEIWICGGQRVYDEVWIKYLYLCKSIFITKLKAEYDCDKFFHCDLEELQKRKIPYIQEKIFESEELEIIRIDLNVTA